MYRSRACFIVYHHLTSITRDVLVTLLFSTFSLPLMSTNFFLFFFLLRFLFFPLFPFSPFPTPLCNSLRFTLHRWHMFAHSRTRARALRTRKDAVTRRTTLSAWMLLRRTVRRQRRDAWRAWIQAMAKHAEAKKQFKRVQVLVCNNVIVYRLGGSHSIALLPCIHHLVFLHCVACSAQSMTHPIT